VKAFRRLNLDYHFLKALYLDIKVLSLTSLRFEIMDHSPEIVTVCWIISKNVDAHQCIPLDQFLAPN